MHFRMIFLKRNGKELDEFVIKDKKEAVFVEESLHILKQALGHRRYACTLIFIKTYLVNALRASFYKKERKKEKKK